MKLSKRNMIITSVLTLIVYTGAFIFTCVNVSASANSKNKGNKELDDLMHDLLTANPKDMKTEVFKREVSKFKTTRRGVKNMCKELEDYVKESEKKGKILTYINLIEKGALNVDEAARYADMSVKALKKEAKRLGASL